MGLVGPYSVVRSGANGCQHIEYWIREVLLGMRPTNYLRFVERVIRESYVGGFLGGALASRESGKVLQQWWTSWEFVSGMLYDPLSGQGEWRDVTTERLGRARATEKACPCIDHPTGCINHPTGCGCVQGKDAEGANDGR